MGSRDTRLFDSPPEPRRQGSTALVWLGECCPDGHGPLLTIREDQPALSRHGGAGATLRSTHRICVVCFWAKPVLLDSVKAGVPSVLTGGR